MNRYLLAGCAAVALAMGAGAANAQAKFEVKVGGDAFFEAGYVDQDLDTNTRSTEFRNRFRVNIIPTAKADNGLEYGGRVRIRAAGSNTNVTGDRAYIFAQGTFGQVRLGVTNSFNDETYVSAPTDYLPLALVDQVINWIAPAVGSNGAVNPGAGASLVTANSIIWPSLNPDAQATKIVYFSPRFAGLQLGASYTPRNDSVNQDVNRVKRSTVAGAQATGSYQDMWEVGANYNETFGGFTVKGSAGFIGASATESNLATDNFKDMNAWQVGAQVGYAGFAIGGSYTDFGKAGQNQIPGRFTERTFNWTAGVQYTTGPIVVGANYKYGQDAGSTLIPGKRKLEVYEVGAGYTVAPGLTLQAQYDYFKSDNETGVPDDKGNVVLLRSVLAF